MDTQRGEASQVIHCAAAVAGVVGALSPIPGADAVLISPIQAALVLKLAMVYEQRPSGSALKAAGYATLGSVMGKGAARLIAAFVPGFGSIVRGGVAVGVTEAIGWAVVENLEENGST